MKKVLYIASFALISGIFACSCSNRVKTENDEQKEKKEALKITSISFYETNHDFGKITQGEKVSHIFKFKNTGENPLEISQAQPSCGCTVPEWTEDPIEPGKEGYIQVMFNSEGRLGKQHKSVTVVANTKPATSQLTFTADVVQK